jgi:hypothetical protein
VNLVGRAVTLCQEKETHAKPPRRKEKKKQRRKDVLLFLFPHLRGRGMLKPDYQEYNIN